MCVQNIQDGKLKAKIEGRPLVDGDINSVCGDSCPAGAITFGDWNDITSAVRKSADDSRSYQALEEIGVRPNVFYKVKVRNEKNSLLEKIQYKREKKEHHGETAAHHGSEHKASH